MSPTNIYVQKRSGKKESLDIEKIHRVVHEACKGISGVSESQIEINAKLKFYDGIKTNDIQETLIKSAAELISEETPNYQYVAGRLINYLLRKQVYGSSHMPRLFDHVKRGVDEGFYDSLLLEYYSEQEWNKIDKFIWHDRDYELTYCAMEQLRGKYLIKNRVTGRFYETPQMCYILIAAILFSKYPKETRLKWVKDYYDAISLHDISLPTPIMAGLRSTQRQFSSCVLIECGDSIDSINATSGAIVKYVSQKAGIGIGAGAIRAVNSPIRNGAAYHTGVIPFLKLFQAGVNSCNQGGVRKGSATCHFPIWHLEVEDLIVLKNNKGTEETRVRHMDYSVQVSKLFYERLINNENITLFSPSDVPELYDSFFSDQEKFKKLYENAEKNPNIRKKVVKALDLFSNLMIERKSTGRIYIMHVDHCNIHSSFYKAVKMSNLCQEITLPTNPLDDLNDPKGLIALCTLSAINWGKIKQTEDFERVCTLAVRGLDALLDYQEFPVRAAEIHTRNYRPLGIGIINFAYFLAKNGVKYGTPECLELVDRYAEAWSYYLIKASVDIQKEIIIPREAGEIISSDVKYDHGILPIDTYKKEVDELVPHIERMPWNELREDLKKYGIRNATLMALMPAETSAQIANATNGVEPPRALVSIKQSKDGVLAQVVPDYKRLKGKYDLLWDQKSPEGYIKTMAVLQKYIDQSISTNTSYNPEFYAEKQLPISTLLKDLLLCYKYGIKTLYYFNTNDGQKEVEVDKLIQETESDQSEVECESCVI